MMAATAPGALQTAAAGAAELDRTARGGDAAPARPVHPDQTWDAATGELVRLAQSGNASALGDLVRLHHPQIYAYLARLSGDRELAKDLSQEVLLRCCTNLGSLRQPGSFRAWMYRMAYRTFLDEHRRRGRRPRPDDGAADLAALTEGTTADGVEQALLRREECRRVRAALLALRPHHRNALVLRFYHELSTEEIARVTGIPAGTVKSRLHYAIARLKAILEVET